ncbi:oxygen-insensitive NADPH nitroreductase, partial [Aeromonas veronii]|nr:oxygen-insensitive NADPH nitroreductase [Aeromonas veronii]
VIPLFGIAVGYPAQMPDKKPRLPFEHIYHEDEYKQDVDLFKQELVTYNQTISDYYQARTNGKRSDTWTGQMANMLENPKRMYMKDFVKGQGLNQK